MLFRSTPSPERLSIEVRDSEALRRRVGLRCYGLLAIQKGQTGALVNISESLLPEAAEHWVYLIQAIADESQAAIATPPETPPSGASV